MKLQKYGMKRRARQSRLSLGVLQESCRKEQDKDVEHGVSRLRVSKTGLVSCVRSTYEDTQVPSSGRVADTKWRVE